jgi:hypothetical protein
MLAALGVGMVDGVEPLRKWSAPDVVVEPNRAGFETARAAWSRAVARARG